MRRASPRPRLRDGWDSPAWSRAETLEIAHFRPESSDHRPRTRVRLLYDDRCLYGVFLVEDRYVRCVHRSFQDPVYRDSCVELFVQPRADLGYLNFELNCGGALSASYIVDPLRTRDGFAAFSRLTEEDGRSVAVHASLPPLVEPEIPGVVEWRIAFALRVPLLERYVGPLRPLAGQEWRANFYKCGDETSHPHWAAWAPVDERNFHLPRCFGTIRFDAP